jgi:Tfp pilus assembly protein PilF
MLSMHQEAEARKGVARGLASGRTPDLLIQDGYLKIVDKHFAEARRSFQEALTKNPDDARALRYLVSSYSAQNQVNAGVAEVRAYAAQHPQSAPVQFFLGELLKETGDVGGAVKVFSALKTAHPDFMPAEFSLTQINLLGSNWRAARPQLESILSVKGEDPIARQWLGMLEVEEGNQTAAIADFRKVVESQPNNALALNNLAFLLAENGQANEALKYAEKAVELAPNRSDFEDTLGWVLYRKGIFDAAVTHLQSAVSKGGGAREQYHLAAAYFRRGDGARGHATLTGALHKDPNLPEAQMAKKAEQESAQKSQP